METSGLGIYAEQLEAFANVLLGSRLSVTTVMGHLVVGDQDAEIVVSCRPRSDDGDRLWFYADDEPLVEADQGRMMDGAVAIKGRLAAAAPGETLHP